MKHLAPEPTPIPPELPNDPSRSPPSDLPLNTPPEKGPGRWDRRGRVELHGLGWLGACAGILICAGSVFAQTPAGKDTSELEPANPQQAGCSQITNS